MGAKMKSIKERIQSMTIEEKAAQLTQLNANVLYMQPSTELTGEDIQFCLSDEVKGNLGSVLTFSEGARKPLQDTYANLQKSSTPLAFMHDVIHGCRTIFPIPLAMGCTFDEALVEDCAEMSAKEAKANGIDVTFSPMVDLTRDCRWGRVMEGTGEDKYLNGEMGKAFIRGYHKGGIACCVKHFACYGAVEAGRDYNTTDMSSYTLHDSYLYAYRECLKENPEMVMTSFNSINGKPVNARKDLLVDLLRERWNYDGVVITDYNAVQEMLFHGCAADKKECAKIAIDNQIDVDMMSDCYVRYLPKLVKEGLVDEKQVDRAVERVLRLKEKLGLFENPDGEAAPQRYQALIGEPSHKALALRAAEKSFVLLKNEGVLPLRKEQKIALVGPFVQERNILGAWSAYGKPSETRHVQEGFSAYLQREIPTAKGCGYGLFDEDESQIPAAVQAARESDVVLACIGEFASHSGEGKSRANPALTEVQLELLRQLKKTGKQVVGIVFAGRPLVLSKAEKYLDAILYVWQPGSEGANAIVRTVYGENNPSGKLTMSFPRSVGQCPIHYDELHGGRRKNIDDFQHYISRGAYIDELNAPLYPFGYGLSYTGFSLSNLQLSSKTLRVGEKVRASVTVRNEGERFGECTIQLYIRDLVSTLLRPVKELKGYQKIGLMPHESVTVSFDIEDNVLSYRNEQGEEVVECGDFEVCLGTDSQELLLERLTRI